MTKSTKIKQTKIKIKIKYVLKLVQNINKQYNIVKK